MSRIIDIDIVVNIDAIKKNSAGWGQRDHPSNIEANDAYMVVRQEGVQCGRATNKSNELAIQIEYTDTVRLRAKPMNDQQSHFVVLYNMENYGGSETFSKITKEGSGAFKHIDGMQEIQLEDTFISCKKKRMGSMTPYLMSFYLVDKRAPDDLLIRDPEVAIRSDYYSWEAMILVM